MSRECDRPGRRLAGAGLVLAAAALVALGWLWRLDRARRWETPLVGPPLVLLRAGADAPGAATWLVAVNPACAHCREALAALAARPPAAARVGALIVDTPRRPSAATIRALPGGPVWWDATNAWRRRWGHRVYGEVMRFDPLGRYRSTGFDPPAPASTPPPSRPRRR